MPTTLNATSSQTNLTTPPATKRKYERRWEEWLPWMNFSKEDASVLRDRLFTRLAILERAGLNMAAIRRTKIDDPRSSDDVFSDRVTRFLDKRSKRKPYAYKQRDGSESATGRS